MFNQEIFYIAHLWGPIFSLPLSTRLTISRTVTTSTSSSSRVFQKVTRVILNDVRIIHSEMVNLKSKKQLNYFQICDCVKMQVIFLKSGLFQCCCYFIKRCSVYPLLTILVIFQYPCSLRMTFSSIFYVTYCHSAYFIFWALFQVVHLSWSCHKIEMQAALCNFLLRKK